MTSENEKPNPASEPLPLGPFATRIREAVQYRGPKDHEDYLTVAREADARIVALETENRRLREALGKADDMVPWFRQGTIWVGGRADHAERVIAGLDQLSPTKYTQECVDTFRGWVNETHRRIGEYESARRALQGDQDVTGA